MRRGQRVAPIERRPGGVARRWGLALAVAGWVVGAGLAAGRGPAQAQPVVPRLELAGQLGGVPQALAVEEPYA